MRLGVENGGEGGIRTHEGLLTLAGFQDQCIQPLCHPSDGRYCRCARVPIQPDRLTFYEKYPLTLAIPGKAFITVGMDQRFYQFRLDPSSGGNGPSSLIGRALAAVAGVAVFIVAIVAGGVLLLAFFALAAAVAAVLGIRFWWWQRKMAKTINERQAGERAGKDGEAIEGEFRVIDDQ